MRQIPNGPFFFFSFLLLHLQHMEVPGLGVKLELHLRRTPQPQQYLILATSVTYTTACINTGSLTHGHYVKFLTHWATTGTPGLSFLIGRFSSLGLPIGLNRTSCPRNPVCWGPVCKSHASERSKVSLLKPTSETHRTLSRLTPGGTGKTWLPPQKWRCLGKVWLQSRASNEEVCLEGQVPRMLSRRTN